MPEIQNTPRQLQVLNALVSRDGRSPSFQEVGDRVGLRSLNAVARHIRILERRGLIAKEAKKRRSIKVLPAGIAALESA
jgi:SOS-response transcriptional repressor LexA